MLRAKLPIPVPQYPIIASGELLARVDFAYPSARIAIEADGSRYHSTQVDRDNDRYRRNRLTAAGWILYHVTWGDLDRRPEKSLPKSGRYCASTWRLESRRCHSRPRQPPKRWSHALRMAADRARGRPRAGAPERHYRILGPGNHP